MPVLIRARPDEDEDAPRRRGRVLIPAGGGKRSLVDDVTGFMSTLNASVPLADEFADAIQAGAELVSGRADGIGEAWRTARGKSSLARQDFKAARPKAAALAAGTGMAAQALPVARVVGAGQAAATIPKALASEGARKGFRELVKRAATGQAAKAAVTGGVSGGLAGVASEGDLEERLYAGNRDAAIGGVIGAGVPALTSAARSGINAGARLVRGEAADRAASTTARILNKIPDIEALPERTGETLPFELMGKPGEKLARAVAAVPGRGQEIAESVLEARKATAPMRMLGRLRETLGTDGGDLHDVLRALDAKRKGEAAPFFRRAEELGPVDSETLRRLYGRAAVKKTIPKAREMASNEDLDPEGLVFDVIEQMSDSASPGDGPTPDGSDLRAPTMRTHLAVKRALDDDVEKLRDPLTGRLVLSPADRLVNNTRHDFNAELERLSTDLAEGNRLYAGPSRQMDAVRRGRQAVTRQQDPEIIEGTAKVLSEDEKGAWNIGVARAVGDKLRGRNPMAFIRQMDTDQVFRDRLRAGFGDDAAFEDFMAQARAEALAQENYNKVLTGSRTTPLREIIDDVNAAGDEGGVASMLADATTRKAGGESLRGQLARALVNRARRMRRPSLNRPEVSELLGEVLFKGRDPREVLERARAQQLITEEEMERLLPIFSSQAGLQLTQ